MQEAKFLTIKITFKQDDATGMRVFYNHEIEPNTPYEKKEIEVLGLPLVLKVTAGAVYFKSLGVCIDCQIREVKKWIYHHIL